MKTLLALLLATLCAATSYAQTIKSLGYNTTTGQVVYTGTNVLTFTNQVSVGDSQAIIGGGNGVLFFFDLDGSKDIFGFDGGEPDVARARGNLGLGATWLTNTNVTNFRTAIGLGATNDVIFNSVGQTGGFFLDFNSGSFSDGTNVLFTISGNWFNPATFYLGARSFGNITITNQSAATNGLLFVYRTNNEPFLGLANLIASNNTTPNNETLFRVGVAEATNKAAQFGFRTTSTNGDGVAVFSVFGFNALAMIGPSARSLSNSLTNTNAAIEADIFSINPTNKVATLIDTNTGALTMHRPVGFNTNATAPANTNTPAGWLQFFVGTNSVRVPYYQ